MRTESSIRESYAAGREAELCCPVSYDPQVLKVPRDEVVERDYACGDPSRWRREGDTVLDLSSGTGVIYLIAAPSRRRHGRVSHQPITSNDD
jgi:arsenite methyltransferase